jgi:DNA-binding transcriptional LysR family regulator
MIQTMQNLSHQAARQLLRRITMAELRSLLAIKSAGNLTRAAQALGISQPALSQQLREVEDKLGMGLFIRHRRGLEATPAGNVMLRLADALNVDLQIAADELALTASQQGTSIRIGSMPITSAGLLAVAVGRLALEMPQVNVVLMEGPRETLLEHLRHRRIDLFIGRLPEIEEVPDLQSETLFLDGAVVVASARHPLGRKARLTMEQLMKHPWVLPAEDTSFFLQIAQSMRAVGLSSPPARVRSYSMLAMPAIVSTSEMLGFLPTSMFGSGALSAGLQRLPVDFNWVASPVGVLMHRELAGNELLERLLGILRSVAASAKAATLAA